MTSVFLIGHKEHVSKLIAIPPVQTKVTIKVNGKGTAKETEKDTEKPNQIENIPDKGVKKGDTTVKKHDQVFGREEKRPCRPAYYKTKFHRKGPHRLQTPIKFCHKTFGFAQVPLSKPENYLKKHSRKRLVPPVCEKAQPKISDAKDKQTFPHILKAKPKSTEKDFLKQNKLNAMRALPRQPDEKIMDDNKGHEQDYEKSGMKLKYVLEKDFGKIPEYLEKISSRVIKKDEQSTTFVPDRTPITARAERSIHAGARISAERNIYAGGAKMSVSRGASMGAGDAATPVASPSPYRYITESERTDILKGLKANWEDMQREFQLLPMLTDTLPKIIRKKKLEDALVQLEKDIRKIEEHPYIYVLADGKECICP